MFKLTQNLAAQTVAGLTGVLLALSLVFGSFAPFQASAASEIEELCLEAAALGVDISTGLFATLCAAVDKDSNSSSNTATGNGFIHHPNVDWTFNTNLRIGSRGVDVLWLQRALNDGGYTVATSGPGSAGNETQFFGPATTRAVQAFQRANNIAPVLGNFFPLTRAEMNRRGAVSVPSNDDNDNDDRDEDDRDEDEDDRDDNRGGNGDLEVSETNTADDAFLSEGMTRFLATSFEIEADDDASINGITIRYSGRPDEDDIIENVVLADADGSILAEDEDFDSDGEAQFDSLDIDLDRGDDIEILVYVTATDSFDTEDDGQDFELQVIEIDADGDVDGLPIVGPEHTVEQDDLGTVTVDIDNEGGQIEIGEDDELFATIEIDADPDDSDDVVFIKQLRIENIGSGDLDEIEDLVAELDGEVYEGVIDPFDDDFVIFTFDDYELEDGDSEDIEIRGSVVDDAGDDYEFDIDDNETYNIYVEHEEGYGMPIEIVRSGSATEVQAATLNIAVSDDDESDEISVGDDIFIGEFEIDIDGEGVDIDEFVLEVSLINGGVVDGGEADDLLLEDVYLEDEDGNRVTDTEDADWDGTEPTDADADAGTASGNQVVEFDNVELEEGDDVTYRIFATIDDNVDTDTEYQITIDEDNITGAEGIRSDENVTPSGGTVLIEERTVEAGDLLFSISTSPSARVIEDDEDDIVLARFNFDTTASGEDIELESFEAFLEVAGSTTDAESDVERLTNCRIFDEDDNELELDEDVDGNDATDGPGSLFSFDFDFDDDLLLENDTVTELELRCDIGSVDNGVTYQWSVTTDADVEAEGVETNNDLEVVVEDGEGGVMTIGEAEIQVLEDASSPSVELVVEDAEVVLGILEIEADDGEVILEDIVLQLNGQSEVLLAERVFVEFDGERVGTANFTSSNIDTVEDVDIRIEDDETIEVTFVGTISTVGEDEDAENGEQISLTVLGVTPEDNDVTVVGTNDGNDDMVDLEDEVVVAGLASSTFIAFDGVVVFETVPAIAEVRYDDQNEELFVGDNELLHFSVSADEAGDITLGQIVLDVELQGGAVLSTDVDTDGNLEGIEVEVSDSPTFNNLVSTADGEFNATPTADPSLFAISFADDNTDNYLEIPDGETYYFRVNIDLDEVTDGSSVRVQINEDEDFASARTAAPHADADQLAAIAAVDDGTVPGEAPAANAPAANPANFVWTPDFNVNDETLWFNGFEVEGVESNIDNSRRRDDN